MKKTLTQAEVTKMLKAQAHASYNVDFCKALHSLALHVTQANPETQRVLKTENPAKWTGHNVNELLMILTMNYKEELVGAFERIADLPEAPDVCNELAGFMTYLDNAGYYAVSRKPQ